MVDTISKLWLQSIAERLAQGLPQNTVFYSDNGDVRKRITAIAGTNGYQCALGIWNGKPGVEIFAHRADGAGVNAFANPSPEVNPFVFADRVK